MPTAVNPTAGAGARTPDATPDATRTALREARRQNALRLERIRESRLAVIEHRESRRRQLTESLSIDWVTPYAELLDLTRRTGDPVIAGPTAAWQRRQGKNWPIYQTEQELNLLRAPARVLFGTNGYAQGLVEGIKSYVLGTGNTYRVAKEDDQDDLPDDAVDAAQNVVDKFLLRTQWFGGELPGIEEELLERSMVDGEFVLCHYPREDGTTDVRTQEPEMLTQPPGGDWREWSFGVRTPYDDAQDQQAFWIQHGDSPEEGEEYSPDEVTFFRRNVTRAMKRGVTDFCFDTYDALYLAGRLRTNLGDTAAQQAAIVAVRQHDSGTKEDIQSFIDADATLTQTEPITGTQLAQKIHRRGSWEDIPKGMNYAPGPIATSTPIHLQVLDACLRGAGQKWQAPPWLMSGDLNAMNYATSLTAESPFVRTVQRRQRSYCEAFRRPVWFALRHWVRTNGLRDRTGRVWSWDEIEGRIKLQVTAPSPETRDKLQDAQRAQIEIPLGVQSRQGYMQEQGRNVDQVEADNQAYQDKFGSDGQQLPLPGADGAAPSDAGGAGARTSADTDALPSLESLLESEGDGTFSVELLEADAPPGKVWKVITVTRGDKQFQQKRLVNAPKADSGKKKAKAKDDPKKGKGPAKPDPATTAAAIKAQLAGDHSKLTPAKVRDLGEKLKGLSVEQLKAIKAEHDLKGGKSKAEHIAKLLDRAKELKKRADAAKRPAAKKPTKVAGAAPQKVGSRADIVKAINGVRVKKNPYAIGAQPLDPKQIDAVATALAASSEDAGEVSAHGMASPERMRKASLDGVEFHWPDTAEGRAHAAETIGMVARHDLPPKLWAATGRVVFTSQANKDDPHWESEYKMPGFKANATGGDGSTVVYGGKPAHAGIFAHEAGHNLAHKEWGSTNPPADSEYGRAQAAESPVSEYGSKSPAEDFAEAVMMYAAGPHNRQKLRDNFPLKYAAVHNLLGET